MSNIHLIKSNSYHLTDLFINDLIKDYKDISKYDLEEIELNDIITDASYYGLFNEGKAIIINNVKYFSGKFLYEDEMNTLCDYLSKIDSKDIIVFVCNDITSTKENTKRVLSIGGEINDLTKLSDEEIDKIINDYLTDNKIKVDKNSLDVLYKRVNNNIDILFSELNKISLVSKNITIDDINKYCSYNFEDVTFDFSNAVISKDFNNVFELLDKLIDAGVEVPSIVGLLASNYSLIYLVKDCLNHNISDEEILNITKMKSSGRLYHLKKNSRIYTLDELKDIIIGLASVDLKIKTGSNPVYILKEFLLSI